MARVLNRNTLELKASVNTPRFPDPPWLRNPDTSAVDGQPSKYWTLTGDVLSLKSQAERDAIDAAELAAGRDAIADQLDSVEDLIRAFALVVLDQINFLRAQHGLAPLTIAQLKTAVRNKLGS